SRLSSISSPARSIPVRPDRGGETVGSIRKFTPGATIQLISGKPMDSQTYQLGFIGAGKLAGSVIRGLVLAGFCSPSKIIASEPSEQARDALVNDTAVNVTTDNAAAAAAAEVVLIAVKPGMVLPVLRQLRGATRDKVVISLAAGVRFDSMERATHARVLRALTNTPST